MILVCTCAYWVNFNRKKSSSIICQIPFLVRFINGYSFVGLTLPVNPETALSNLQIRIEKKDRVETSSGPELESWAS
jgi:hypothetical protein